MKKMKKLKKGKKAKKMKKLDLGAIFDAHIRHIHLDHTGPPKKKPRAAKPSANTAPPPPGGDGPAGVVIFYPHLFVGKRPADTRIERISRTVGRDQVVDELILYF